MNCCNDNGVCTQGFNCPARSTPLMCKNGGQKVNTQKDEHECDEGLDLLDKIIWILFMLGAGGFYVMTIIQIARWING